MNTNFIYIVVIAAIIFSRQLIANERFIRDFETQKIESELAKNLATWNKSSSEAKEFFKHIRTSTARDNLANIKETGQMYKDDLAKFKTNNEKYMSAWADGVRKLAAKMCGVDTANKIICNIEVRVLPKTNNTFSMYPVLVKGKEFELKNLVIEISDTIRESRQESGVGTFLYQKVGVKSFNTFQEIYFNIPEIKNPFNSSEVLQKFQEMVRADIPKGETEDKIYAAKVIATDDATPQEIEYGPYGAYHDTGEGFHANCRPSSYVYFENERCNIVAYREGFAQALPPLISATHKIIVASDRFSVTWRNLQEGKGIVPISCESNIPDGLYQFSATGEITAVGEDFELMPDQCFSVVTPGTKYLGLGYDSSLGSHEKQFRDALCPIQKYGSNWPNVIKAHEFVYASFLSSIDLGSNKLDQQFLDVFNNGVDDSYRPERDRAKQMSQEAALRVKQIILSDWKSLADLKLVKSLSSTFANLEEIYFKGVDLTKDSERAEFQKAVDKIKETLGAQSKISIRY